VSDNVESIQNKLETQGFYSADDKVAKESLEKEEDSTDDDH